MSVVSERSAYHSKQTHRCVMWVHTNWLTTASMLQRLAMIVLREPTEWIWFAESRIVLRITSKISLLPMSWKEQINHPIEVRSIYRCSQSLFIRNACSQPHKHTTVYWNRKTEIDPAVLLRIIHESWIHNIQIDFNLLESAADVKLGNMGLPSNSMWIAVASLSQTRVHSFSINCFHWYLLRSYVIVNSRPIFWCARHAAHRMYRMCTINGEMPIFFIEIEVKLLSFFFSFMHAINMWRLYCGCYVKIESENGENKHFSFLSNSNCNKLHSIWWKKLEHLWWSVKETYCGRIPNRRWQFMVTIINFFNEYSARFRSIIGENI